MRTATIPKTSRGNFRVTYTTPRYSMQQVSEEAAGDIKNDANTLTPRLS